MSNKESSAARRGGGAIRILIIALCALIAAAVITILLNRYIFSMVTVSGTSMEPTVNAGESWVIDRTFGGLNRGDIVTFRTEDSDDASLSRIVAAGGDAVYIDLQSGRLYINGSLADEPYANIAAGVGGKFITELINNGSYSKESPLVIEEGYLFVMGDNRGNSRDSREFGPIPESAVFGVVTRKVK